MTEEFVLQGRRLNATDVEWIGGLLAKHPEWNRTRLSREICRCWAWNDEVGRLKDMACRTLLLKLERRGLVRLPARQSHPRNDRRGRTFQPVLHQTAAIQGPLAELLPIT